MHRLLAAGLAAVKLLLNKSLVKYQACRAAVNRYTDGSPMRLTEGTDSENFTVKTTHCIKPLWVLTHFALGRQKI